MFMPGLHLPQAPYNNFAYVFSYDFSGIVGDFRLRRMCLHFMCPSCDFCTNSRGINRVIRTEAVRRLYGHRTIIKNSIISVGQSKICYNNTRTSNRYVFFYKCPLKDVRRRFARTNFTLSVTGHLYTKKNK